MIEKVDYSHINWGPYVMKTKLPDYIIKKLKAEGKKARVHYNHKLAGHLDNQYLYPEKVQQWFYTELQPVVQAYRTGHCKFHGIEELDIEMNADDLWVNYMQAGDFNPLHTHGGDYSFVLFLDVASLWGVDYDSSIDDSNKIRSAIGFGVDWFTPIGPLNFSLASPITKASSDETESFRFNLGTTF